MTQWYVKDLSKQTGVSAQTLHHYDHIGLLTPSVRNASGYRLYDEKDLLKLQQIVALKYFGFTLSRIKSLLASPQDLTEHFSMQVNFLEEKGNTLLEASQNLRSILSSCSPSQPIPWKNIIQMIEVFNMTKQLEKTWAGKVLTPEELQQYAHFEAGLKERFTLGDKSAFEAAWEQLVADITAHLHEDPTGPLGIKLGGRMMTLVNGLYGTEHANLKKAIWEKGFMKGKMDKDHALNPELVTWMDRAADTYYRERIYGLLDKVSHPAPAGLQAAWEDLMTEMFGNAAPLKAEVVQVVQSDPRVSDTAKAWLMSIGGQ
jgi:DNA-binding transcriptional MerR regulator